MCHILIKDAARELKIMPNLVRLTVRLSLLLIAASAKMPESLGILQMILYCDFNLMILISLEQHNLLIHKKFAGSSHTYTLLTYYNFISVMGTDFVLFTIWCFKLESCHRSSHVARV